MSRSARVIGQPWLGVILALATTVAVSGQTTRETPRSADPEAQFRASMKALEGQFPGGEISVAREQYEKRAAEIALRIDPAAAASRENAALLYYQALLAHRQPDPATTRLLNALSRGGEPNTPIKAYLGRSLPALELVQIASQMPRCDWGPMRVGGQQLDFNLGVPLRWLSRLLDADARTLAADGHARAALARGLTIRRLAHHAGDNTYNLFSISQSIHTMALLAVAHVLSTRAPDAETLVWLKGQLAAVPGTPFQPAPVLRKWRDAELQFWRTRPPGRAFQRELVLAKVPDANDRTVFAALTDDQLLVIALQAEQRVPGRYGGLSAPPELLERARQECDRYLESALEIMKANLSYRDKHTKLQEMVDSLEGRDGEPIAILLDAPKAVEVYHRLMIRNALYDNLVAVAIEVCLVQANTGQLPRTLPSGLPKDLFTDKDFEYERTGRGFVLRFDPDNLTRIRVRRFEFTTQNADSPSR
jgi:hypothetical protein